MSGHINIIVGDSSSDDGKKPGAAKPGGSAGKPYLGVKFLCANGAYTRFYKNKAATHYEGRCPQCMRAVRIGIGSHGTSTRFFSYDCGKL